jgi:hypothetical protein
LSTYFALTFCDHVDRGLNKEFISLLKGKIYSNELDRYGFKNTFKNICELNRRYPTIPVKYIEFGKSFFDVLQIVHV